MKKLLCIYCLLCMTALACAQNLKFNANGKFKIVQFTDVHYIFNDPRAEVAIERINEVLNAENPDLVMFTGDVIYGKPAEKSMRTVLEQVSKRKIPFAVTCSFNSFEYSFNFASRASTFGPRQSGLVAMEMPQTLGWLRAERYTSSR